MISLSKTAGEVCKTLKIVRRRVDHASLWNTIITLVVGNRGHLLNFCSMHLERVTENWIYIYRISFGINLELRDHMVLKLSKNKFSQSASYDTHSGGRVSTPRVRWKEMRSLANWLKPFLEKPSCFSLNPTGVMMPDMKGFPSAPGPSGSS